MNEKSRYQHVEHEFGPVCNGESKVLILGSFPSVKSREQQFYYGHPQNRFWKVIAAITDTPLALTVCERKKQLLENQIAVWDVIASCDMIGSSDSSIRNVVVNRVPELIAQSSISMVFANGDKAYRLYLKYLAQEIALPVRKLPSTSPANAACSLERLTEEWDIVRETLQNRQDERNQTV